MTSAVPPPPAPLIEGPAVGAERPSPPTPDVFTEFDARRLGRVRRYFAKHPRAMDWCIVVLWGGVEALQIASGATDQPGIAALIVLASCAALLYRRLAPVWTCAAIAALLVIAFATVRTEMGVDFAAALAVYAVAANRPAAIAWAAGVGVFALDLAAIWNLCSCAPATFVITDASTQDSEAISPALTMLILILAALAIGSNVRGRREHVATLVERANALARDRGRQADLAVAAERARISRDMHDVVAHSLTVMIALADGARAAAPTDPAQSARALEELSGTGRGALADLRRLLGAMRVDELVPGDRPPAPQDDPDLAAAIEEIARAFRTAGLPVRTNWTPAEAGGAAIPLAVRLAVRRIVSESLTNALRYAPDADVVTVELTHRPGVDGWLGVTITDTAGPPAAPPVRMAGAPSRPAAPSLGAGRGIIGMRERASVLGGTLTAGPTATGWQVRAVLPSGDRREPVGERSDPVGERSDGGGADRPLPAEPEPGPPEPTQPKSGPPPRQQPQYPQPHHEG